MSRRERRDFSINVRLNEQERERFDRLAREADLPLSILLRQLVRREVGLPARITRTAAEDALPTWNHRAADEDK